MGIVPTGAASVVHRLEKRPHTHSLDRGEETFAEVFAAVSLHGARQRGPGPYWISWPCISYP